VVIMSIDNVKFNVFVTLYQCVIVTVFPPEFDPFWLATMVQLTAIGCQEHGRRLTINLQRLVFQFTYNKPFLVHTLRPSYWKLNFSVTHC